MKRYLQQKRAQLSLSIARFIFAKHDNKYLQKLANWLAAKNRQRHGAQTLDFLDACDSHDEKF